MHIADDFPIVSNQIDRTELRVIVCELQRVLDAGVSGDVVELGCYVGTTSLFLQRVLAKTDRILHVYDSFEGLPPKARQDASPIGEQFKQGELTASKAQLIKNFKQAGLPLPVIRKAWFESLKEADMPSSIAFAFLDGDFYTSIMASLKVVWPKLSLGATVVVDDYQTEALPGVAQAIKDWSVNHSFTFRVEASLALLTIR